MVTQIWVEIGKPKMLITDEGYEFTSRLFNKMCESNRIVYHTTAPDKYQSNGRVERAIRKIWQVIRKESEKGKVNDKQIPDLIKRINQTYCRAVGKTPIEAWHEEASKPAEYKKEFKKLYREKFNVDDEVYIAELADKNCSKLGSKFPKEGKILEVLENDSYLIESKGKVFKRNHACIKKKEKFSA